MQRLWRWVAALVGLAALLLALGIGAFRLAIDLLPGYQQRVVDRVHEATGLTLQFDSVYARIGRYGPEVVFRGARVLPETGDEPLVTAASGRVSLSIPRSLWYRRLEVGRVSFVRPRLSFVITSDGHIRLVGQSALQRRDEEHAPMTLDRLPRGHYAVDDATLDVLDLRSRQGRFQLTGADIDVRRKGNEITVVGRVELPGHLGSFIDFEGQANGDLEDTAKVAWRAHVDARDLDLEQWAATLPDSFRVPVAGHGSIRVSARGAGREVMSLRVQPALADLRLAGSTEEFTRVAGDIRVQRDATTVSLEAAGFELSRAGRPWRPTSVEARLTRKDGRIAAVAARADYLRIENLAVLAAALPQGALRERIAILAPRGELIGLNLAVTDLGAHRIPDITGQLRFTDIGFGPLGKAAGISGFDGDIEGRGAGGIVNLATRDATIDWPQQWRAPAPVVRGDGRIEWQRFGEWRAHLARRRVRGQRPRQRARQGPDAAPAWRVAAHGCQRDGHGFRRDPALALPADRSTEPGVDPLAGRGLSRGPRDAGQGLHYRPDTRIPVSRGTGRVSRERPRGGRDPLLCARLAGTAGN